MDRGPIRGRLDLVFLPIVNPNTGQVIEVPYPDPRRYEWREFQGRRYLYDTLDDSAIEAGAFWDGMKKLPNLPVYDQQPQINDGPAYVEGRRETIRNRLLGQASIATYSSPSEELL